MDDRKRVLIVDDEKDLVKMVALQLEASGYEVISAYDGQEGLNKAREENPDLIILDLMLPRLDGYKVCRMLKFDDKYKNIPIVIFTGRAQEEDEKLGYETGANAYIVKPFRLNTLLDKIDELVGGCLPRGQA